MYKFLILFSFFNFFTLLASWAQSAPPYARIKNLQIGGNGCNQNNSSVTMTDDLSVLSILFDGFKLELGKNSETPRAKQVVKNCVIVMTVEIPAGWTMQFDAVEYRGFASLPDTQTVATQLIAVEASGSPGNQFQENRIVGPYMDNFSHVYTKTPNSVTVSNDLPIRSNGVGRGGVPGGPGGGRFGDRPFRRGDLMKCSDHAQTTAFRIRSRVSLATNSANLDLAQLIVDSSDSSFSQKLRMNWAKCL